MLVTRLSIAQYGMADCDGLDDISKVDALGMEQANIKSEVGGSIETELNCVLLCNTRRM